MATGTQDSQARFGQSVKGLLTEKVNTCGTDVIALTKQVLKGSRSSEENIVLLQRPTMHMTIVLLIINPKQCILATRLQQEDPLKKKMAAHSNILTWKSLHSPPPPLLIHLAHHMLKQSI
ncbi:hypothetical protein FD754_011470 [Muntiacus muntjak]|uniref:BLOC-1-related complex subunit 7 n=1 Tax=Muntiacus muntjak TaxID=9888 RepID=A0A5N3VCB9_MUNMU|nr:hypothetical protein FD754_011470 [Muntiacus muntjak]